MSYQWISAGIAGLLRQSGNANILVYRFPIQRYSALFSVTQHYSALFSIIQHYSALFSIRGYLQIYPYDKIPLRIEYHIYMKEIFG
jgi:hypothetical protein